MKMRIAMFMIALSLGLLGGSAYADGKKLVVVVARGSSVTNIARTDLVHCYSGEPVSAGGRKLIPFNAPPSSPERVAFDKIILGMTPDQVGRYWIDRKIRGQRGAPRALPSPAHIAKVAAKFPGAIGYIPADQLTPEVQPLTIDGIAYTDDRYDVVAR